MRTRQHSTESICRNHLVLHDFVMMGLNVLFTGKLLSNRVVGRSGSLSPSSPNETGEAAALLPIVQVPLTGHLKSPIIQAFLCRISYPLFRLRERG